MSILKKLSLLVKLVIVVFITALIIDSCSIVEPNYEGVLMENYGRNGKEDFKTVTGW